MTIHLNIFNNDSQASTSVPAEGVNTNTTEQAPVVPAAQPVPFEDLLGTVLNDQGQPKYSNVPDALKGLSHAQTHIQSLESEMAILKSELDKRKSVEDALQAFTPKNEPVINQSSGLSEEAVASLLDKRLQEMKQQEISKVNITKVTSALQQKFGEKAEESFYGKAAEVGLSKEQANTLAMNSPDVILALFGQVTTPAINVNSSSINTAGLQPQQQAIPTMMDGGKERISLPMGEKSMLLGTSTKDLLSEMQRHKAAVYSKYNLSL